MTDGVYLRHFTVLDDRLAILTERELGSSDILHISSTDLQSWSTSTLPHRHMSLTTYQSKFVAVGGRHPSSGEPTNVLFTSNVKLQWQPTLPPMSIKRLSTSSVSTRSPEMLVVAGGEDSNGSMLDLVEVLFGDNWTTVKPLPTACSDMHSAIHNGNLYFVGGIGQEHTVYTCSCSSLISVNEKSLNLTTADRPLWNQFKGPDDYPDAASYGSYLVSVDGGCNIKAYSSVTQSWIEATSTENRGQEYYDSVVAAVLHTGDLVCAHRYGGVYRVKLLGEKCMY